MRAIYGPRLRDTDTTDPSVHVVSVYAETQLPAINVWKSWHRRLGKRKTPSADKPYSTRRLPSVIPEISGMVRGCAIFAKICAFWERPENVRIPRGPRGAAMGRFENAGRLFKLDPTFHTLAALNYQARVGFQKKFAKSRKPSLLRTYFVKHDTKRTANADL